MKSSTQTDTKEPIEKVVNASYSRNNRSMGDLQREGLAVKIHRPCGSYMESGWLYLGDKPIQCDNQVLNKGDQTEMILWDPS